MFSLSWSPDDKLIASTDFDSLQVWQSTSGKCIYQTQLPDGSIEAVAWSPDGKLIASVEDLKGDGSLKGQNPLGGQSPAFHYPVSSDFAEVQSLAWSPDGQLIAVGGRDGVRIFTVAKGVIVFEQKEDATIPRVVWSPNGRYLA